MEYIKQDYGALSTADSTTETIETVPDNKPVMLSLKSAAQKFGLSYYMTRYLALSGAIAAVRAGSGKGRILINEQSLVAYLNGSRLTDEQEEQPRSVGGIRVLGR
ncbi:MAG: hypothetical protein IJ784_01345 [Ruminiclostridium sp.]|uniref:hypothetical protein n=1 Tax=Ruminococcus sp. TaxID=41978 RepID=UPI0025E78479|nr:hypothetical protein [Ruminococcus sp.]MBR1433032.1 hypothetical protein [Ruminococcus sp.]MBR1831061.1 hypothetical protein [Ruminiclostridium sp.]